MEQWINMFSYRCFRCHWMIWVEVSAKIIEFPTFHVEKPGEFEENEEHVVVIFSKSIRKWPSPIEELIYEYINF